jgi:hypothetical protein
MRLINVAFMLVLASGCKSDTEKACFESTIPKTVVSACGELCDKSDGKACHQQATIGLEACMTKHDAEVCRWMCHYSKDGADLFCKEYTKQTGKVAE